MSAGLATPESGVESVCKTPNESPLASALSAPPIRHVIIWKGIAGTMPIPTFRRVFNPETYRSMRWYFNEWRRWRTRRITVDTTNPYETRDEEGNLIIRSAEHSELNEALAAGTYYPSHTLSKSYSVGTDAQNRNDVSQYTTPSTESIFDAIPDSGPWGVRYGYGVNNGWSGDYTTSRGGPFQNWPEDDENDTSHQINERDVDVWDYSWTSDLQNPDLTYQAQRIVETRSNEFTQAECSTAFNRVLNELIAQNLDSVWTTPIKPLGAVLYGFNQPYIYRTVSGELYMYGLYSGSMPGSQPCNLDMDAFEDAFTTFSAPVYDAEVYPESSETTNPGTRSGTSTNPVAMEWKHTATKTYRIQIKVLMRTDYTIFERIGFVDYTSPAINALRFRVVATGVLESGQIIELPPPSVREFPSIVSGVATNDCVVGFLPFISLETYVAQQGGQIVQTFVPEE